MKVTGYILIIFFFCNSCSAQHYRLIGATHTTTLGGVEGARSENFNLIVKKNSKIQLKYLLIGNIKLALQQENRNDVIYLKGIYLPESSQKTIDENGEVHNPAAYEVFDLNNAYLVSENIKNKKQIKQKVNFSKNKKHNDSNEILLNEEKLAE